MHYLSFGGCGVHPKPDAPLRATLTRHPSVADWSPMKANELVLVQGMADTKSALREWNTQPWQTLRVWLAWSLLTAVGLLVAVYVVALLSHPDPTPLALPGVNADATFADAQRVIFKNSLVLALHAMACVAGFLAGS